MFQYCHCVHELHCEAHTFGLESGGQTDESLLYKVIMSGPSTDPCRTKVDKQRAADWQLCSQTDWDHLERCDSIYLRNIETSKNKQITEKLTQCQMPSRDQETISLSDWNVIYSITKQVAVSPPVTTPVQASWYLQTSVAFQISCEWVDN